MGNLVKKMPCKKCRANGNDKSGDNLAVYEDGSCYCFACGYTEPSDKWLAEHSNDSDWIEEGEVVTKEKITKEEVERIKGYTGVKGHSLRGISDETYKSYAVRHKYSEESGEPIAQYYPIFKDDELTGFKVRTLPKDFSVIGQCGKDSDLFGQWRFKNCSGKFVVLTAGEIDCLSAYQMLEDYRKSKGADFDPIPVLSTTIGESGSAKQLANHYEYLNRFDKIIVCYDEDEAGKKAVDTLVKVLPKGKMFVMSLPMKDTNEMLQAGKQKQWIDAFWKARQYAPAGIVASGSIYEEIVERAKVEKLPFPPMMKKVNSVLAGGVNYGYICNILAGSGSGKSSLINQCVAYWMTELDLNVGVVSLEAEAGEFGENLLSHYMGKKIALISDTEERINFVGSQEASEAAFSLFNRPDGTARLFLLDDRGDFTNLQEKMEELVITCGCKVIVVDVVSDVFSGMTIEQIDKWMSWSKQFVKRHNCILFHVSHVRKSGSGEKSASQGAFMSEEAIIGSGTQYRSAGVNIALQRDKTNEDEIIRNTTAVHVLKSRSTGWTGHACDLFYSSETHTLWDKEEWQATNCGNMFN